MAWLAAHSAMLASAAISAIITKKLAFAMLLQKPPRNPARMSAGNVVANQTPIRMEVVPAGASLEIKATPTRARGRPPKGANAKKPPNPSAPALPGAPPTPGSLHHIGNGDPQH